MNLLVSILYSRALKAIISFTTFIRTTTQITLLLAAIVLVACGGGGGGGGAGAASSNPDDDADPGVASTDSPTSPKIVEASSADTTTASLSWLTSTDNQTPSDQINYHIYLSAEKGFDMSGDIPHQTLQGVGSAILSSLTADTRYFAKIAAVDGDGNRSISNEMEFKTSDVPAQRTTLDVNDSDAATIEESQITYENPAQDVEVGQVVVGEITKEDGSINGGFLRKVTDVSTVNGQTVATTEPTTLPEVFEKFAFTTSGVITAPASTKPNANSNTTKSFRVNKNNKVEVTTRKKWEQTRFTIIDESIAETKKPKTSNRFTPLNVQLNDEDNVVVNDNLQIKGARSVLLNPGDALKLHLVAELIGDLNNTITISSFEVKDFDNSEITSTKPDYGAQFTNDVVAESDGRVFRNKINFYWVPKSRHVTEEPYILTVKAKEDKDDWYDDSLTYKVYIYVTNGSTEEIGKEEKKLSKTNVEGNLTFESNMEIGFEPVLKAEGNFGITGLKTASVIASGKLTLNQDMVIKALGSAELKEESEKLINRKFIKIVVAGGVPIIISGELTVHAELEASAEAKLEVNHDFDASYEIEIGVDYDSNRTGDRWHPYKKSVPIYTYALKGEANARVTGEVRLVPELTIEIYEAAYGKLKIEPYLNETLALEGYFKYTESYTPTTDFNINWDADYRFTELNLKGGVDIKIRMGLDLFSKEGEDLIGYPSRDQNDFKVFKPIDNKPIFALSKIEAIEEEPVTNLADSRVIKLSTPSITDVPHPLTGISSFGDKHRESLNPFDHNSIHWSSQGVGTEITHLSDNKKEAHLFYTKPTATPFSVKIAGNSSLNKFIRQYETLDIDLTDSDLNGIPEYWENTYKDTDDDELDYRAEFQHGTFPDKNDSDNDGMPDGWEVRYGLKPLKNDATVDIDHDGKTNLEEYQQSTDPTKLPIPIIYRVVEGDKKVEFSWLQVAGASVYRVYQDGTEIDQTVFTSYTATKLTNYTKYTFTVSAYNAFADSLVSNPIVATPQKETIAPPTPTGLSAEVGDKQISLSWNLVTNAADYRVYQNGTLIETLTDTSHTVTGLTNGTQYSFQVMARNSAGESGLSNAVSATPKASIVIPQNPTGLSAEAGDEQVSLSWNIVTGADDYKVYQNGTLIETVKDTSYTVTSLTNGTQYSFQVMARNSAGESELSSAVTATPMVSPQVTNVSPKQVVLDQLTEFTIKGTNLPSTLAFYIPYCQNMSQIGYSSSLATFSCTPSSSTTDDGIVGLGNQTYLVKDAPGGMTLDTGVITVSAEPEEETPEIEITSINPKTVLLNEEATFTISGTNMPDTTVMFIPDCTSEENQSTVGTSTSRTYTCTPSGTVGNKTYEIKKMSKGELLATGIVLVTQAQINISASELSVDGYEETNSVTLDTDSATNWTVAESSDWIAVTPASGTGDATLSIVTSTSSVATERQGSITVTAGSVSETISITQAARAIVNNVTPLSVEEGSTTTFTATGSGLTSSFVVHIDDITISNITTNAAGTELTFLGTANQQTGQKNGVIKRYSAPAVNCAENVDHAACPLQATFSVGIVAKAYINVSASELSVDGYEETNSVTLDTDSATNWTVAESSDWITVTPASGTGDATLSIVTSTSSVATERQGSITVTAGSVSETISITQAARAIVNNVTPLSVEEGSSTTFTVTGSGLTSDFVVHIDDITISNITTNAAGTELTFLGTANQQAGQKNGVIKRYSAPAVNCAENVDHAACPLQATFSVGIVAKAYINVSASELSVDGYEETNSVTLDTDSATNWTVAESSDWIAVTPASGTGDATLSIVTSTSSVATEREGSITVTAGSVSETISITQAARAIVNNVTPLSVEEGSSTTFTVTGSGLTSDFVVHIDDITISNITTNAAGTELTFLGTANQQAGQKNGVIKRYSAPAVNCAENVDHAACPLQATFSVGIVAKAYINVSASELSVDGYEETNSVTLDTDSATNWTVAESSDWIAVTPASGTGDATLSIVTSTSSVATERQGSITVTAGSVSETISITQAARAIVNNVTPLSVEEGSSTTFTVTGSGLTSDFVVHIDDITISNITTNAAGIELTFLGTANQQTGQKNGVIKRYSAPAVNCAENVDHAACPLQATFYVGIEAIANQAPSAPSFSSIADGVAQRVVLVNYQSGADPDGTKVKTRCTATDSNRTEGAPYESIWVANGATDKASFIFQRGGDKTISCTTYDEQNASSETATASISIREIEQEPILASGFSFSGTAFNVGQQMTLNWELDKQTTFALFLQTESGSDVNVTGIYPNACSGSSYIGTGGCVAYQTTGTTAYNFTVSGELKGESYKFALKTWRSGETQPELVYSKPFTVINDNPAPTAPQLLEPLSGASSVGRPYIFKWKNSVDSDGEQIFYSIHLSTDSTFPDGSATTVISGIKQSNTLSTAYAIPQRLSSSTKYYWKVSATDGNTHTESSYRYFTTAYEAPVTSNALETPNRMAHVVNVDPIYISTSPFASTKGLSKRAIGSDVEVEFEGGCDFYNRGYNKIKFWLKKNNSRFYSKLNEACDGSWSQWVELNAGKNEYYISSQCFSSTSAGNCTPGTWASSESAKRSIYLIKKPEELSVDGYEDRISIRIRDIDLYGCGSDNPDCDKYFRIWRATENKPYGERWSRVTSWRRYDGDITIDDQRLDEDSNLDNVDRGFDLYTGETFYYFMEIAPDASSKYASEFSNGAEGKLRPRSPTLPEIYSDIPAVIHTGQEITLNFKRGLAYESDKVQIGCYAYGGNANYTSYNIYRSSFADDYDVEPITFKFYNTSVQSIKCYSEDEDGNSSEVITFPVNIEGINSPTNITAAIDDTNLVTLSWRDNSYYDYRVYRTTSKSCDLLNNPAACSDLLVDIATSSPWQDDTVGQETTYYYWVESIQGNDYALSQSSASVTTALVIPPSQITGLSAVEEIEQLDINWDANLDAQSYNLYWHTSADIGVTSGSYTAKVNTEETTYTLTDLFGGTTYYLIVTGENVVGEGPSSNVVIATPTRAPLATSLAVDAYQQVNNVRLNIGASTSWQVIDSSDWITVTPQSGTGTGSISVTTATSPYADERGGTITIFADGISEDIQVTQAARPIINSLMPLSVEVGSTTTFTATGSGLRSVFFAHIDDIAISNVSANAEGTELTFTGIANQQTGQKNGVIKRHSSAVNCAVEVDHVSCPLKAFFTVGITLQVPTDLHVTSGDQKVTLSWSQAGSNASYRVHQANESFENIDVAANYSVLDGYSFYDTPETAMKVTGLTNYNTYRFVVTAIDGNEESLASNEVTVMPGPLLLGFGSTHSISHHPDPETKQFVAGTTAGVFLFSYADDGVITKERVFSGHTGSVDSVAYSPNGSRIVSGSRDKTIRIWDANTGTQIGNALIGHTSLVVSVAYSPDGGRIISGSQDKTIRIWDANTGAQIGNALTGHTGSVYSVAYSPDGNRIISGSQDKTIRIWDSNTGIQIGDALTGSTGYVNSVAYSPDGNRIVSGGSYIRIWDATSGVQVGSEITGHSTKIKSVAYSPDGNRIISGSRDKTIRVWDANTGVQIGNPLVHLASVESVAYGLDGRKLVSSDSEGVIRIWNVSTETEIGHMVTGHYGEVASTAYSPDGTKIASGGDDRTIRIWDADTGMHIKTLSGHTSRVASLSYSPDGSKLVSSAWDKTVRIWDADTGLQIGGALTGHTDYFVESVAYSPSGNRVVSGGADKTIRIWDTSTGEQVGNSITGHLSGVTSVAYSPDSNRIISGSDNTIKIWDANTGEQVGNSLTGHTGLIVSVAYSPDGSRIISGSWDKTIRIWDANTGEQIGNALIGHTDIVSSVAFNVDGSKIVSGSYDSVIKVWDASTGLQIGNSITGHAGRVYSVAFNIDGSKIVSGGADNTVRVWDISQSDPIANPQPVGSIDGDIGGADIIR